MVTLSPTAPLHCVAQASRPTSGLCAPQLSVLEKLSQNLCPKAHSGWLFHTSVLRDHPFLFSSTHSWFNLSSRGSCHRGALPIAARCAALNAGVESEEML